MGFQKKIWKISNVFRPKAPPTTPHSVIWYIDVCVPKRKTLTLLNFQNVNWFIRNTDFPENSFWNISDVCRPPTTPRSLFWHINCAVPKWKILNMVLDVYKSHDISLHLNWKDVSTVLWSCSGTGVRELSKFKWAFTNFFKLAQTKRPSKWQLEWILGRLGPGQLGPVHFVKIHKWQFLWNIKLDCYLGSLSGPEGGGHNF